jgi:hypothetical protein
MTRRVAGHAAADLQLPAACRLQRCSSDRRAGPVGGPARQRPCYYERTAWAFFSGSQMLMWRVSGITNRAMRKHTAGTTMG